MSEQPRTCGECAAIRPADAKHPTPWCLPYRFGVKPTGKACRSIHAVKDDDGQGRLL